MQCDKAVDYPLLATIGSSLYHDVERFMENRLAILEGKLLPNSLWIE